MLRHFATAALPGLAFVYHEGLEFYLDVSRMRFDNAFVERAAQVEKAFPGYILALEAGAIANLMKPHGWSHWLT